MHRTVPTYSLRRACAALVVLAGTLASGWAEAAVLTNPVAVSAIAPGGFTGNAAEAFALSDSVNPAIGLTAGDSSNIGADFMLPGEFISFVDNSIHVHVAAGDSNGAGQGITGVFGDGLSHARYEFDNLAFAGKVITGITVFGFDGFGTSGFSGLLAPLVASDFVSFDGSDRVTLELDELIFASRGSGASLDFAEFRIDLNTRDIVQPPNGAPEPASAGLVLAALLGLRLSRRRPRHH